MEYTSNSDKITRDYFDSLLLESRYIDSCLPSTKLELYGKTFDTPIMTAALSHLGNTAKNGMEIYAEAAAKSNAVHWVGMGSDEELEKIVSTGAATIKIIKPHEDNREVFRKIEHAVNAGCFAVGMDIDHAFNASGGYDNVMGLPMKSKSTEELKDFVQASKIPFVVKGVLSAHDAERCLKAGVKGIVLSHHHGIMPYSVPPLLVLPEIAEAVSNAIPIFVDCGIESGADAYKCLALGASAVSVGRHLMPLLKNGAESVSARINEMNGELASLMARTGVSDLNHFDASVIHKRLF
ncbi:MAG: alpha-hydroxy-acid oxidizing protein [Treponema sp.]|nr:alpha-hydroxy-acid oxidizing protein [Treponema sp.]